MSGRVFRAGERGLKHEKINIDGKEYDLTALSPEAYEQYNAYQIVVSELSRLTAKAQITRNVRAYHAALLRDLIAPKNA